MSLEEILKSGKAEEKPKLPLNITIEDPNTGETSVIHPKFFVGVYTRNDTGLKNNEVVVGQRIQGYSSVLDEVHVVKLLQEAVIPQILAHMNSKVSSLKREGRFPGTILDSILSSYLFGDLSLKED